MASMDYFYSDMSKSTTTVVCFDWKTVNMKIYPPQRIIFPEGNARREYDTRE
jgi:hypothetical protein